MITFLDAILIGYVFGSLSMFAFMVLSIRKVYRDNAQRIIAFELSLIEAKKSILKMIDYSHHYGAHPIMRSLEGLIMLAQNRNNSIREYNTMLGKDNHHKYAPLQLKDIAEMEEILKRSKEQVSRIDEEIMSLVKKMEDVNL